MSKECIHFLGHSVYVCVCVGGTATPPLPEYVSVI